MARRSNPNRNKHLQARNAAYVNKRRAESVCAHCGANERIEFHRVGHNLTPNRRIFRMKYSTWSIAEIEREISQCTPLCRPCHLKETARNGETSRGSQRACAILTETDIPEIRSRLALGEKHASIAATYGVSPSTIGSVASGKSWKHVPHHDGDLVAHCANCEENPAAEDSLCLPCAQLRDAQPVRQEHDNPLIAEDVRLDRAVYASMDDGYRKRQFFARAVSLF